MSLLSFAFTFFSLISCNPLFCFRADGISKNGLEIAVARALVLQSY